MPTTRNPVGRRLKSPIVHGHTRNGQSRTYKSWAQMWQRCNNPNDKAWPNYGGRGIRVHLPWKSFVVFLSDMGECPPEHEIDRVNNDGDYHPSNCRWGTEAQQSRNKRSTRVFVVGGITACLTDHCKRLGFVRETVRSRLERGWPVERAFTERLHLNQWV